MFAESLKNMCVCYSVCVCEGEEEHMTVSVQTY